MALFSRLSSLSRKICILFSFFYATVHFIRKHRGLLGGLSEWRILSLYRDSTVTTSRPEYSLAHRDPVIWNTMIAIKNLKAKLKNIGTLMTSIFVLSAWHWHSQWLEKFGPIIPRCWLHSNNLLYSRILSSSILYILSLQQNKPCYFGYSNKHF